MAAADPAARRRALLPRALQVVPGIVMVRVAAAITASAGLLALLGYGLRAWPLVAASLFAGLTLLGLYVGWCLWPRWRWGLAGCLGTLPLPPGQQVRLSFDDGPTPGVTDAVLDLLRQHGVRASFFVLLPKARANPPLIRRIVAEGHVLGLHGEDHRAPFFRPAGELCASLRRARQELATLAGLPVVLYRPSHGWKNLALRRAVADAGLRVVFWDYGVWDTDAPPADTLVRRLQAVTPAAPPASDDGAPILLLHDGRGDPPAAPPHARPMLEALRRWLPDATAAPAGDRRILSLQRG